MMHMHIKQWAQSLIVFGPMKCADSKKHTLAIWMLWPTTSKS